MDELEVGPDLLRQHMSCWKKYKAEDRCRDAKNALEQSKGEVVFFTTNTCPVCLSSYEEVIVGGDHVVVPPCGHPICCSCYDGLLRHDGGKFPTCKEGLEISKSDIMKFDADLRLLPHEGKLYC